MKELSGDDRTPEFHSFMKDLVELCKKHGCAMGHQDGHGAFEVHFSTDLKDEHHQWVMDANQLMD